MATQPDQKNGASVRERRARRLARKLRARDGAEKQSAPVLPARSRTTMVMPTKAVDEWPDGKERWPSLMTASSLHSVLSAEEKAHGEINGPCACLLEDIPGASVEEVWAKPACSRRRNISFMFSSGTRKALPTRFFNVSVMTSLSPLGFDRNQNKLYRQLKKRLHYLAARAAKTP
jgi:hypothetical protein